MVSRRETPLLRVWPCHFPSTPPLSSHPKIPPPSPQYIWFQKNTNWHQGKWILANWFSNTLVSFLFFIYPSPMPWVTTIQGIAYQTCYGVWYKYKMHVLVYNGFQYRFSRNCFLFQQYSTVLLPCQYIRSNSLLLKLRLFNLHCTVIFNKLN